jgi:tetratricopeptide (TPR) repeat protein
MTRGSERGRAVAIRVLLVAVVGIAPLDTRADDILRGDASWRARAEGEREGRPAPGPIREAVRYYERALSARPESLEARWKLLRALHFAGDFVARESQERRATFDHALAVSDQGMERLARQLGAGRLEDMDPPAIRRQLEARSVPVTDVARLYFWSAIHWGAWSREAGLVRAVRQGVANRIHRYTSLAIALEPEYEEGGAFRLLGRLHAELPRVPFVSGWVDRDASIPLLERAYAIAPANPGNRLLLALSLLDLAPERRAEALDLLKQVEGLTPRASMRIEDLVMRREARDRLSEGRDGETT